MQKGQKIKTATRRVARATQPSKSKWQKFWARTWQIICWPFKKIAIICTRIWKWICGIDLIGLVNITLLIAIIVLFSMLIIDILKFKKPQVVVVAPHTVEVTNDNYTPRRTVKQRPNVVLPIKQNTATRKMIAKPVQVVPTPAPTIQVATDTPTGKMYGDIIIDNRADGTILHNGTQIKGNLFLQNMRKYTLPCNIKIEGNLFLRDLNMLQFCGDFIITGNIYVSPRSSFGPIPRTARLGGQVIL